MRQHTFSAVITFDPSARQADILRYLGATRTSGVIQPGPGQYFPAAICCPGSPPPHAMVRIPLLEGEAEMFFDAGQVFTVWADAVMDDDVIHGEGLLGSGVVVHQEPAAPSSSAGQEAAPAAANRPLPYRGIVPPPRPGTAAPTPAGRR